MKVNDFRELEEQKVNIADHSNFFIRFRAIVASTRSEGIFGVAILHKHFDLSPSEELLQSYIKIRDCLLTRVVDKRSLESLSTTPMQWGISSDGISSSVLQHAFDIRPLDKNQSGTLLELLQLIHSAGLGNLFSVIRIDRNLEIWNNKILTETTFSKQRLQFAYPTTSESSQSAIATYWNSDMKILGDCIAAPNGHYGD